jgi:hypothetical protein
MNFLDVLKQDARWILDQGPVVSDEFELHCSQSIRDLIFSDLKNIGFYIPDAHFGLSDSEIPVITRLGIPGVGYVSITVKEQPGYDLSLKLPNL